MGFEELLLSYIRVQSDLSGSVDLAEESLKHYSLLCEICDC